MGSACGALRDCNEANAHLAVSVRGRADTFAANKTNLSWTAPSDPGGTQPLLYDVFRATQISPATPVYTCFTPDTPSLSTTDNTHPPASRAYLYLIRAQNGCGTGTLGNSSTGAPARTVPNCP
jgi:hypothetical protein